MRRGVKRRCDGGGQGRLVCPANKHGCGCAQSLICMVGCPLLLHTHLSRAERQPTHRSSAFHPTTNTRQSRQAHVHYIVPPHHPDKWLSFPPCLPTSFQPPCHYGVQSVIGSVIALPLSLPPSSYLVTVQSVT
ncbi:hypothetical protein E2C01_057253 [Portunus trituberculatus]|uniref:Uncharacterized protein n=1 Tax=Portunus trituberculatus TaxID=210409 RepID=A0A5B7GZU0_PORTR|nr:hypothetical protein [Portunus trituberculatus]